jgi:cell division protein FtsA
VPLALSKSVIDKHQKEHGVLNIDFGGGMSSMALFHEGELIHTAMFPIGSRHITNDIAVAFRIPMDKAEMIKCHYGSLIPDATQNKETVDISELVGEEGFVIPRKQINRIVEARVSEMFDMVSNELKKVSYNYMLPAGVVLSGGGAKLHGMLPYAKNRLRLSGLIGVPYTFENMPEELRDPAFAVAAGLVMWGADQFSHDGGSSSTSFGGKISNPFRSEGVKKVTKWLKNFMP